MGKVKELWEQNQEEAEQPNPDSEKEENYIVAQDAVEHYDDDEEGAQ